MKVMTTPFSSDFRRHDISNAIWNKIEPILPGRRGSWGGIAKDNRRFVNAVCRVFRTGAPWLEACIDEPDNGMAHGG